MKKTALISMAVSLGLASLPVNAAKPQSVSPNMDLAVSCSCDWSADPGVCTLSWNDIGARDYGASLHFEASWNDGDGVSMSQARLNLGNGVVCGSGMCSASGEFVLPQFAENAAVTFEGDVKGFPPSGTPRKVVKAKGACNLPGDGSGADVEAPIGGDVPT